MSTQQQHTTTTKGKFGPMTIKGAWNLVRRSFEENNVKDAPPSLRAYARGQASRSETHPIVADAKRWLSVKRPGGSDEQRQERKARRKERQSINAAAKAAKKGKGKTNLKPSGEGKKKR
jgi:hypothetical protein